MTLGATAAQAQVPTLTDEYLAGKWHENRACAGSADYEFSIVFQTLQIGRGDPTDYAISGPQEIALGAAGTPIGLQIVDQDTMLMSIGTSQTAIYRCPSSTASAQFPAPAAPAAAPPAFPPPPTAPATVSPSALTPAFLFGRWTATNCAVAGTFRPDGTFVEANGVTVNWALGAGFLTFSLPSGFSDTVTLRAIDANTVQRIDTAGNVLTMRRCP